MNIVVLDGMPLNPGDLDWAPLRELGTVTVHERTAPDQVAERIASADAVFTNKVKLTAEAIATATGLRFIGEMATGYDNIDVSAAVAQGITVSNVPSYSSAFTAQTAIALLLELAMRTGRHADLVKEGRWTSCPDFSFWEGPLVQLDGKTLLVVGLGTIGRKVAKAGTALGMEVIAASLPGRRPSSDAQHLPLDEALPISDVVTLHCPLTPETRGLISAERLKLFKPGARLVNTARGGLIDEAAVAQALKSGHLAGFAADVLSSEPPAASSPLLTAPNTIITPHLGWASPEARTSLLAVSAANLKAFIAGDPQNVLGWG